MSEHTPQAPQDERPEAPVEEAVEEVVEVDESSDPAATPDGEDAPQLSYHEYLKLTNPGKSDEEIAKMIRKENRYAWLVRFQILAFIVFLVIILFFIFNH